jgi:hypothetical protein
VAAGAFGYPKEPTIGKNLYRAALERLGPTTRVRFARVRAAAWAVVGVVSFPLGWANSVILVWIASAYANMASELAAGEAADDAAVTDRLDRLEAILKRIEARPTCSCSYPEEAGTARDAPGPARRDGDPQEAGHERPAQPE